MSDEQQQTVIEFAPDLRCIRVPNRIGPSGQASNVYVLGEDPVILIDAGGADPDSTVIHSLLALGGPVVSDIYLTHTHQDHAGGATAIAEATGATTWLPERDLDEQARVHAPDLKVDRWLNPGHVIQHGRWSLEAIETPGHAPGHVSLRDRPTGALFAGDLISGNGTIAVVPPRGSMSAYVGSLYRVKERGVAEVYPGHGPMIPDGMGVLDAYLERRISREDEILELIAGGVDTLDALVDRIYDDVIPTLRGLARGTLLAHILKLIEESRVETSSSDPEQATFTVVPVRAN